MSNVFQQHGAFSWSELMTSDPAAAKEFYGQLFGWKMEDTPMTGMIYTTIAAGGQPMGGLTALPLNAPSMPPTWGIYITVDNVDESAKLAETLGGKILMSPMDIPGTGRFSLIQDPQGATFCIISYAPSYSGASSGAS
ncbi:MAG: VOC family protein [Oculatellaceae cyanobacterium Prado106]|jgi:hypothetical protein|nr:VOC family protein [Oculatellaceae cyanobacterium Prado106]